MKKRPSSIDVARLANVSQATVSYVLSGRSDKRISEATRNRVQAAADELGYLPNRLADGILRGKTSTVGVLMSDFSHSFTGQVLQGLGEAFGIAGYRALIAHNRNDPEFERHQVRMLMEHRVDGIVAVTDENTIDGLHVWVAEAAKAGVPVVIVDDRKLDGIADTIVSEDVEGARRAVEHLIAQGHRQIAYLGAGEGTSSSRDRRQGYESALAEHGLRHDPTWILGTSYHRNEDPDLSSLLTMGHRPTAVFAASDGLAAGAISKLAERGVRVPEDIAFVGYGDLEFARYLNLTTVSQNPSEMGRRAALRLLERIQNGPGEPVTERLPTELVVRLSSAKVPSQDRR